MAMTKRGRGPGPPRLSRVQLANLVSAMRRVDWELVERRLNAARIRERSGTVVLDGFGPGKDFNARSASSGVADPTASAALGRASGASIGRADHHREHTLGALVALEQAVEATNVLVSHLVAITALITPDDEQGAMCEPCQAGGIHHAAMHWGRVAGRLNEPVHLCSDAYHFVRRHGVLPTADQVRHHDLTGRWRVTVTPPDRRPRWPTKK